MALQSYWQSVGKWTGVAAFTLAVLVATKPHPMDYLLPALIALPVCVGLVCVVLGVARLLAARKGGDKAG